MFKLDAIARIQRVLFEIGEEQKDLIEKADTDPVAYYKGMVPILHEKLTAYEIDVLTEQCALQLSRTGNTTYDDAYAFFEMLYKFRIDPTFFGMLGLNRREPDEAEGPDCISS